MESISSAVRIREAKREDMQQIFKFIKDLATFVKCDSEQVVKITAENLIKDGFDTDPPAFNCIVAEASTGGHLLGYAIYCSKYSTWLGKTIYLEDLFVDAENRKNGIGKKLLSFVAKIAYETSGQLDFTVLGWNPAVDFYEKCGAVNLTKTQERLYFRVSGHSLEKLSEA